MGTNRGKFITLEGVEGCGKTTQVALLADFLEARGISCVKTKEPGGTEIGSKIREILLHAANHGMNSVCEALLYLADRAQHHSELVAPALAAGKWVISDRYHDSTLAYQGAARGIPAEDLGRIFQLATGGLKPDLTLLLDLDPRVGLERARQRNRDREMMESEGRFEAERLQFHEAVRRSFLKMADEEPGRFAVLSAEQEPERVAKSIAGLIEKRWMGTLV